MSEASQLEAWDHTAVIVAKMHNAWAGKDSRISDPFSLNPIRKARRDRTLARQPDPSPEEVARMLTDAFVRV